MKRITIAIAAIIVMASCSKNELKEEGNKKPIEFTTVVGNNTKATTGLIDLTALKASTDGFAVSTNGLGASDEMNSVAVTYNNTNLTWNYTGDYFWPISPSQNVSFTAYAPAGTPNILLTGTGLTATNFIPSATVGSQIDLIYAAPANFNRLTSSSGVALTFNHILSQIVFSITTDIPAADNPKIVSIVLTVPQNKGSYNGTSWTPAASSQSYTLFNNNALSGTAVTSTPLLLIPQTLPVGTNATITFNVNGASSSNTIDLSTLTTVTSWQPGTKVTYNVLFNNNDLKIKFTDPTISSWTNTSDGIIY